MDRTSAVQDHLFQWDRAQVKIIDVRHLTVVLPDLCHACVLPAGSFLYVIRGSAHIQTGDRSYRVRPGFVIHSGKGQELQIEPLIEDCEMYWILYQAEHTSSDMLPCMHVEPSGAPLDIQYGFLSKSSVILLDLVKQLYESWHRGSDRDRLFQKGLLLQFVHEVVCQLDEGNEEQGLQGDPVSHIVQYIHEHYGKPLSLQHLADYVNYSVAHLSSIFKEQIGISPIEYLIQLRINKAAELMMENDAPLREISAKVGYKDVYYFGRIFKKVTGVAPSRFKKQKRIDVSIESEYSPAFILRSSLETLRDKGYIDNDYQYKLGGSTAMIRFVKPGVAAAMLLCAMLVLSACGGAAGTNNGVNQKPAGNQTSNSQSAGKEANQGAEQQSRTIKHALGETVIEGVPQRVVVLEWSIAEDVLALGVQPVGMADIKGMQKWVKVPVEIGSDVVDIGVRNAPDMELLTSLEPDLIIGLDRNLETSYEAMSSIAPTIAYQPYPVEDGRDQYDAMVDTFNEIADILGKKDEAAAVMKQLDDTYAAAKAKITEAGKLDAPFVLAMGYSNQDAVVFRLSTDNALAVKVLEHIGLKNAHKPEKTEVYGFTTADVEALPALQDANFLHIIQDDDNVIENQLKNNAVWKSLNFVKENRVYGLGGDVWPYGGPLSSQILAQKAADLLTK